MIAGIFGKISNQSHFLRVLGSNAIATDDFFRAHLDGMVDSRHPLAVLASRMPSSDLEAALASAFAYKHRKGCVI